MKSELLDYFLHPKKTGYDIPKTLVYALVLVGAVYLIYRALRRSKVKIDRRLGVGLAPYVVFGGAIRVLQDAGVVNSYFFITPGVYLFVFLIVFVVLLLSLYIERKKGIPYFKTLFLAGVCLLPLTLAQLTLKNFYGPLVVLALFSPWLVLFRVLKWDLANKAVSLLHIFDATTTSTAIKFFGYYEQHVVPTFFIGLFGPFSFVILKVIAIIAALLLIDKFGGKSKEEEEFKSYVKLIIGILGGATACRDFITLAALV